MAKYSPIAQMPLLHGLRWLEVVLTCFSAFQMMGTQLTVRN